MAVNSSPILVGCIAAVVACTGGDSDVCGVWSAPSLKGTLPSGALEEASGLAASRLSAGVFWAHDDDGGEDGFLRAISSSGDLLGSILLPGVAPEDWEDVASVELDGQAWLVVGDIGDNDGVRDQVRIWWVPEPDDATIDTVLSAVEGVRFSYPDGPTDAEALVVDPTDGSVVVFTRESDRVRVFEVPAGGGDASLRNTTNFADTALGGLGAVRAADVSPDGERLYLRGDDGVVWTPIDGGSVWGGLDSACVTPDPPESDGEGIAAVADGYYTIGEGSPAELWRVQESS